MAVRYRLLPKAESDFFGIYDYTITNFGENQAEEYIGGLLDAFTLITEHNRIGRSIGQIRIGYFRYEYERHTIYYRQDRDTISIIRILGEKQDPLRHL